MLSRVADALFWMSRYLERAEHVARLLDVCYHLEVDLRGAQAGPYELHWTSLLATLQQAPPVPGADGARQRSIAEWLTFDSNNPGSIMACVTRARANARSIRGSLSAEVWRSLNTLYWRLNDPAFSGPARESPHEFYQAVESGSCLFQGVCDATLDHDEGWQFMQIGKYLERAEKTLRILDIQYHLLQELSDPADLPLSHLQWAAVLRSCRAYEAHQRRYVGRIDPEKVVEFLLLHPSFPRSVRFALEEAARALSSVESAGPTRGLSQADRLLGLVLGELKYRELGQILQGDLHAFLGGVLERCGQVGLAVQERYSLH